MQENSKMKPPKVEYLEERIPHADWSSLRPWDGFGRKDLGFRAKGIGRAREGERKGEKTV